MARSPPMNSKWASLMIIAAALSGGCKQATLPDLFKSEGFAELRPPSKLLPPGTMIYKLEENPLQVGIACTQEASLGPGLEVESSGTTTSSFAKSVKRELTLAPEDLGLVTAQTQYSKIASIDAQLANVTVYELPVSTVAERIAQRSDACKAAVEILTRDEKEIGLVTAVIEADVTYTIDFDQSVSAELQSEITGKLGIELGLDAGSASNNTIAGEGLYWGLRELREEVLLGLVPKGEGAATETFVGLRPVGVSDAPPLAG